MKVWDTGSGFFLLMLVLCDDLLPVDCEACIRWPNVSRRGVSDV
jgi:hypothetical protein